MSQKCAPFKIGEKVRVVAISDEAGDPKFIGKKGVIKAFDYTSGCGESYPADPLIVVRFRWGRIDSFWKEELVRS